MNLGRTVFSQIMEHLPEYEFQKCVARYRGDSHLRGFSCLDQYLAMSFAQLTYRESLRDIEACLRSVASKLYHMGLRGKVSRTTLADANDSHDWRIFADFAQVLVAIARPLYAGDPAAPPNQGLLRYQPERGEDPNLDRDLGLLAGGDHPQAPGTRCQPLPDSTDFERDAFRENAHFTGPSAIRLPRRFTRFR
jgi:hypothetical protein